MINLPSAAQVDVVDRLALTTGRHPVPEVKADVGYVHLSDKFADAGLTRAQSQTVLPPRILECPVQLEAEVTYIYPLADDDPTQAGGTVAVEARITLVHVDPSVPMADQQHRIDPDLWRPLI